MLSQLHTLHLKQLHPETEPDQSNIPCFEVWCSCQWRGHCHTLRMAETFVHSHETAQIIRGNRVIIERELLDKPTSLVDARQE